MIAELLFFWIGCAGADAQLAAARQALDQADAASASRVLTSLETSHPDCTELVLLRARLRAAEGNAAEAERLFLQYTNDAAPRDPRGFVEFAAYLLARRQYPRADAISERAVEVGPDSPDALALRGQILMMKGQPEAAVEFLKKACALDPHNVRAHFQLGAYADRNHRPAEAVEHFRQVTAADPRDPRAWDYLALNLEPLGRIEEAEAAYRTGLAVNAPPRLDYFLDFNYGRFLLKRTRLEESRKHLDRAVELAPSTRAVVYERAKLNLRLRNYPQARADAEKALSLTDPAGIILDLQVYYLLEQVYARLGETDLARKYAELSRSTPVPLRPENTGRK